MLEQLQQQLEKDYHIGYAYYVIYVVVLQMFSILDVPFYLLDISSETRLFHMLLHGSPERLIKMRNLLA
jgi:hypothetical protein